ncbi:hypothetical protein GCM10009107_22760 [Ideonella azotifigens]|uniref:Uncharacterized protein n=1 Tax=Ideonella azotifigens TaxID=513160 RepID=A0ABN1K0F6_9BURK
MTANDKEPMAYATATASREVAMSIEAGDGETAHRNEIPGVECKLPDRPAWLASALKTCANASPGNTEALPAGDYHPGLQPPPRLHRPGRRAAGVR